MQGLMHTIVYYISGPIYDAKCPYNWDFDRYKERKFTSVGLASNMMYQLCSLNRDGMHQMLIQMA